MEDHPSTLSQHQLLILVWVTLGVVYIVVGMRLAVRFVHFRRLLVDDYILIVSMLSATTLGVMHTLMLPGIFAMRRGVPVEGAAFDLLTRAQFASKILFWQSFYIIKASILVFLYPILSSLKSARRAWIIVTCIVAACALACFLSLMTECTPITENFKQPSKCAPDFAKSRLFLTGLSVMDILTDFLILLLPLPLLWTLRHTLTRAQLLSLLALFSSGGVIIIFAFLRVQRIWTNAPIEDVPYQITVAVTWAQIETIVSVIVGTVPAFKLLFVRKRPMNVERHLVTWADGGSVTPTRNKSGPTVVDSVVASPSSG